MRNLLGISDFLRTLNPGERNVQIIVAIASAKHIVTKGMVEFEFNWYEMTRDKYTMVDGLHRLVEITEVAILDNVELIKFLERIGDDVFERFISFFAEDYSTEDLINNIRELYSRDRYNSLSVTPDKVLELAAKVLDIKENSTVIDSFCGLFGVINAVKSEFKKEQKDFSNIRFYGQEYNTETYMMGQLIAFLGAGRNAVIEQGDSIFNPGFIDSNSELMKFDYALSSPPFITIRASEDYRDNYGRFRLAENGYMRHFNNSWMAVEHIIATLKEDGKAAILIPIGPLFRGANTDKTIRKSFINEDIIECLIKLPGGILGYTAIESVLMIINKDKDMARRNKVQFIDLSEKTQVKGRRVKEIPEEVIDEAVKLFKDFTDSEISFIMRDEEIAEKDYNLDIFSEIEKEELTKKLDNWKSIKLSDVATIRRGVQLTKSKIEVMNKEEDKSHYLVSIGNIVDGKIVLEEKDKISPDNRMVDLYEVQRGDIVITSKGSLIKVALIDETIENAIISSNLCMIRVNKNKYNPVVLKYFLESEIGMSMLNAISKGAVIKSISNKDLESLDIPDINPIQQDTIAGYIENVVKNYKREIEEAQKRYEEGQREILEMMNL